MPLVTCPECRHQQVHRGSTSGALLVCEKCGSPYHLDGGKSKRALTVAESTPSSDDISSNTLLRSGLLLGGLVLVVVILFGGFVFFMKAKESAKQREIERQAEAERRKSQPPRKQTPEELKEKEEAAERRAEQAERTARTGISYAIVAVVFIYGLVLFLCGGWMAGDAYPRGMNGLAWATFYFAFHLVSRFALYPIVLIPATAAAISAPDAGIGLVLMVEPAAWMGLWIYLACRRSGTMIPCPNCRNRKVMSLTVCPHCSYSCPPMAHVADDSEPEQGSSH